MNQKLHYYTKLRILKLRWGEDLDELPRRIHNSVPEISKIVGILKSTIYKFLSVYKRNGLLERIKSLPKVPGSQKLTEDQINNLISKETLQIWQNKTIAMRVKEIEETFGVKISSTSLRSLYRFNNISLQRPSYKFYRTLKNPRLLHLEKV
jgi:transposase